MKNTSLFAMFLLLSGGATEAQITPSAPMDSLTTFIEGSSAVSPGGPLDADQGDAPDQVMQPLSGVFEPDFDEQEQEQEGRSLFTPGLFVSEFWDSNPFQQRHNSRWGRVTSFTGSARLKRDWVHNSFNLKYSGGALFRDVHSPFHSNAFPSKSAFHSLGFAQNLVFGRWSVVLGDDMNYQPFGGLGGSGIPGGFNTGALKLRPGTAPNQSIFTGNIRRFSNTAITQIDYSLSARNSITASTSFAQLHFLDDSFFDNNQLRASLGFNRMFTRRDTGSILYAYSRFRFPGSSVDLETQSAQLQYSRNLSNRLVLQLSGGPQYLNSKGFNPGHSIGTTVQGLFHYRLPRTNFTLSYSRGITGGAGVLRGAKTTHVQFAATRVVSRLWTASGNFGYAHNSSLQNHNVFDSGFAGGSAQRQVGQYTAVSLNYNTQRQFQRFGCFGATCRTFTRHSIGVSFHWNYRPIVVR